MLTSSLLIVAERPAFVAAMLLGFVVAMVVAVIIWGLFDAILYFIKKVLQ